MSGTLPPPVLLESTRQGSPDNFQSLLGIEECVRYYPPNLEAVQQPAAILSNEFSSRIDREIDIFVDVPFCNTICGFCPFNVYSTAGAEVGLYLTALEKEISLIRALHDFRQAKIRTIWIGGGTPSILDDDSLDTLLRFLKENFDLSSVREFTVEVKPVVKTLTESQLGILRKHKVNRISMGVQSTHNEFLKVLGRGHTREVALKAITEIKDAGFVLNIDMMYRLPGETLAHVEADLGVIRSLGIDHISWFPYVPHAGTSLANRIDSGNVVTPAGRTEYFKMFNAVLERMTDVGYQQYTPYYFSKGRECQYHIDRWKMPQLEILGIGPGAFAFFNGWIYTNQHSPAQYRRAIGDQKPPIMMGKKLSSTERITRLAVLGIKFFMIDMKEFQQHSGAQMDQFYGRELELLGKSGLIEIRDNQVHCTLLGKAFNNDIATVFGTDTARRTKHPQAIDLMRIRV